MDTSRSYLQLIQKHKEGDKDIRAQSTRSYYCCGLIFDGDVINSCVRVCVCVRLIQPTKERVDIIIEYIQLFMNFNQTHLPYMMTCLKAW